MVLENSVLFTFTDILIDRLSVQSNVSIILMNQSVLRLIIPHTFQMLTFWFDDWRFDLNKWFASLLLICSLLIRTDGLINIVIGCIIRYSRWTWYCLVIDAIVVLITLFSLLKLNYWLLIAVTLFTASSLYWSLAINTNTVLIRYVLSWQKPVAIVNGYFPNDDCLYGSCGR